MVYKRSWKYILALGQLHTKLPQVLSVESWRDRLEDYCVVRVRLVIDQNVRLCLDSKQLRKLPVDAALIQVIVIYFDIPCLCEGVNLGHFIGMCRH
jgi:hypothetical protein